jgi:AcrR family transcriptional regulator
MDSSPIAKRSRRSETTRSTLLAAAGKVFATSGYADANVNDIVDTVGMSVGSLYHHFASKAELYIELFNNYQTRQAHRARQAFFAAVTAGEIDPVQQFLAGMRAYLEGAWQDREMARIFMPGGGPPGFDLLLRSRFQSWLQINAIELSQQGRPLDATLLLLLTTIASEAGREVALQTSKAKARRLIEEVLEYSSQLHPLDAKRRTAVGSSR